MSNVVRARVIHNRSHKAGQSRILYRLLMVELYVAVVIVARLQFTLHGVSRLGVRVVVAILGQLVHQRNVLSKGHVMSMV